MSDDELTYGPPRWTSAALVGIGVVAAVVGWQLDRPGRLLAAIAAIALVLAGAWVLGGPVLRAGADGIAVRGWIQTHTVDWSEIDRIHVDARRRSAAVEIETSDRLLVVSAILLGQVRPAEVAASLAALRPAG
jgi:hypothetical protein